MTAENKIYDIVKRPLVQSALTEALERQGATFDKILKPLIDGLDANLVARTFEPENRNRNRGELRQGCFGPP